MIPSQEFVVGKHNIGYVGSDFLSRMGDAEFQMKPVPTFQKLPRYMNDGEIESELKPGLCDLGDVLSFIENPPEGSKDGNWNLFYTPTFVVDVSWYGDGWDVGTWSRDGLKWHTDYRVFSPATGSSNPKAFTLDSSDTLTLERAIEIVKKEGYRIFKEM